jgi:hypothetical protein
MSRRHWRSGLCAVCAAVMFAGEGCAGDDLSRQPVSGVVSMDGSPLSQGAIVFYPDTSMPHEDTVMGGAMINGGHFALPRSEGLVPGYYEISINSGETNEPRRRDTRDPGNDRAVQKDRIPAKYNTHTTLVIEIKDAAIKEMTIRLASE